MVAVLAALCMLITSCSTRPTASNTHVSATSHSRGFGYLGTNWAQPLPGGVATTVAGASSQAGFPVPMPNDPPVASQANLTDVWVDGSAQQVALVFDQGTVDVELWPWPQFYPDPMTRFQQLVNTLSATVTIDQVNGQPALVIQPNTDYIKANRAWVEFDLNGIDINISSATDSTDMLLQVAESMSTTTTTPSPTPSSSSYPSPSPSPSSS